MLSPSRADESEPLLFVLFTGSGDAGVSPKECGPSVAGDEIPTFPSALPDREGASSSLSEPRDQEDLEPSRKRMKGGQSLGVLCVLALVGVLGSQRDCSSCFRWGLPFSRSLRICLRQTPVVPQLFGMEI